MGALSGMERALHFCFNSAASNTPCEDAVLQIDLVALTVLCSHCNEIKTPAARYNFRCPDCGRPTPRVVTGREMELVSVKLEPRGTNATDVVHPVAASTRSTEGVRNV
jgi:hydrogenase nickel incorporation protein HypA/HybF